MERCTIRLKTGEARCAQLDGNVVVERLAAYEDTEREPEEVTALGKLFDYALKESKTLTEQLALLNHIRELAEADKDGRCVVLPCKVGDTVYQLRKKTHARGIGISPRIVSSACVWADGSYALTHQGMSYCQSRDLGKTWFLTRAEAEKVLQQMEGENGIENSKSYPEKDELDGTLRQ